MRILLLVSCKCPFAFPGCREEVDRAEAVDLIGCEELGEYFIHDAGHAVCLRAIFGFVPVGEVEIADERVVDEGLQDDRHETGTAQVKKTAKAGGAARRGGRVAFYVSEVFGGVTMVVSAPALASWIAEPLESQRQHSIAL